MNSTKWLTKHPKLVTRISSLVLITAFSIAAAIVLKLPPLAIVGIDLGIALAVYVTIFMIIASPIARAERIFKTNCDPEPLISELQFQLTAPKAENAKREIALDLALALSDAGQSTDATRIMDSLAESLSVLPCDIRFNYHSIYSHILHSVKKYHEAENQYSLALSAYEEIAKKQNVSQTHWILQAEHLLRRSDYKACVEILESLCPANKREEIIIKLYLSCAYISLGEAKKAEGLIEFILQSGNKLCYVSDAKDLLKNAQ